MFISKSLTKKSLENLIKQSFQFLKFSQSSALSDCIKNIGFYYATAAGISISLEDLKTPALKGQLIQEIDASFEKISQSWSLGLISDVDRFQSVIDNWNSGTELLKDQIVNHFSLNDPLNTLYLMAFSGARGNMSQVRQVIGMRGLMVNQDGDIIDMPIQANFREGLSAIDYIISSYGARKGVVDTALKTADAGYLTRRLIYVAQEVTIKAVDCKSDITQSFTLLKESSISDLIGKNLTIITNLEGKPIEYLKKGQTFLTKDFLSKIKKDAPLILFYRSTLGCKIQGGTCQVCYGWDASKFEKVDLGSAVGIIAAQSIGEPGTQLTMRTFHTGGIFSGQFISYQASPCSGRLSLPLNFKMEFSKTSHGKGVPLLLEDIFVTIMSLDGKKTSVFIPRSSCLHFSEESFIKKGQILSEYSQDSKIVYQKKQHPVRAPFDGIILNLKLSARFFSSKNLKITKKNGSLWLASGQIYNTSWGSKLSYKRFLSNGNSFSYSKIVSPISGAFSSNSEMGELKISNNFKHAKLAIGQLSNLSFCGKIQPIVKNFSFIDAHSIFAYYYYYPLINERIYRVQEYSIKKNERKTSFFFITDKDVWKTYFDNPRQFSKKKQMVFFGEPIAPNLRALSSGKLFARDGFKHTYQKSFSLSVPQGAILIANKGKLLKKNKTVAYLVRSKQKGDDIVQGLPKIEELLEARKTKNAATLFSMPSIFLGGWVTGVTNLYKSVSKQSIKNVAYYKVDISLREDDLFTSISKVRKLPLNSFDRRKVRKLAHKKYVLGGFFQGISADNILSDDLKIGYEMLPIKQLETFSPTPVKILPLNILAYTNFGQASECIINNLPTTKYDKLRNNSLSAFLWLKENKECKSLRLISLPYIRSPKFPSVIKRSNLALSKIEKEFSNRFFCNLAYNFSKEKTSKILAYSEVISPIIATNNIQVSNINTLKHEYYRIQPYFAGYSHFFADLVKPKARISEFLDIGRPVTEGKIDPHKMLKCLFGYHYNSDGLYVGAAKSVYKLQLILLNSVQSVYRSQGVNILNIHIELVLRELTSKARIRFSNGEVFYLNEIVSLKAVSELERIYEEQNKKKLIYEPMLLPISKASLQKSGFLAAAGFQETRYVLAKAAIEGRKDWARGLKESIILGRPIPAGSAFLSSKHYLDSMFFYKSI
jgi:hypothetical protein